MGLKKYKAKRDFEKTPEPKGEKSKASEGSFVIQKHHARSLHYDLRLEVGGVLKSWAVPKGAPKKIGEKHLAVMTEDHPLEYAKFEGIIPKGEYGAGKVEIWDLGRFVNLKEISIRTQLKKGVVEFKLLGKRLKSCYALIHFKENQWLWMKIREKKNG